ncbi:unnamed protein product [Nyctereutes procyonoides]|uniref:(raccoon dog) hypothetical protein n=1 Tax=Nyctereutes procyonoides TaxID=34880 RepID=A0A811Y1U9_NYCPR|nr:unnamed protein product [Nyctereutes procyonoides]
MVLQRLFRFSSVIRSASLSPFEEDHWYYSIPAKAEREVFKLKQMYGKADVRDAWVAELVNMYPNFKFEAIEKPQS